MYDYVYIYIYMCVCVCVMIFDDICAYVYIYMCVFKYVCIYVCVMIFHDICTYCIYIHIHVVVWWMSRLDQDLKSPIHACCVKAMLLFLYRYCGFHIPILGSVMFNVYMEYSWSETFGAWPKELQSLWRILAEMQLQFGIWRHRRLSSNCWRPFKSD